MKMPKFKETKNFFWKKLIKKTSQTLIFIKKKTILMKITEIINITNE